MALLILPAMSGCIFDGDGDDGWDPDEFSASDLNAPQVNTDLVPDRPTLPDSSGNTQEVGYSYALEWSFSNNMIYEKYGSTLQLGIENAGDTDIFITEFGFIPSWEDDGYFRDCAVEVPSESTADLGLLSFDGPSRSGDSYYWIQLSMMVKNPKGDWVDMGRLDLDKEDREYVDVEPLLNMETENSVEVNTEQYYDKINSKVSFTDRSVLKTARSAASSYSGEYSIGQVISIFEYIQEEISYVSDPSGEANYWASCDETLEVGAGDCEDQAILFSSMVGAIGGTTRMVLTNDHAFATLYIGDQDHADDVVEALRNYYGTDLNIFYFRDDLGCWLIADTLSFFYLGNLPLGGEPTSATGSGWAWGFPDASELIFIDVIPQ